MNVDVEVERLSSCYKNVIDAVSDSSFFLNSISYMEVIESSPMLQGIVQSKLELEANSDLFRLRELSDIVFKDGSSKANELLEKKIVINSVSQDIIFHRNNLANFIKNEYMNKVDDFIGMLNRLLIAMDWSEEKGLVKISHDNAILNKEEGRVIAWSWSDKLVDYEVEKNKVDRIKDVRVWFQYNELVSMYEIYMNHETQQKMFLDQGQFWKAWNYSGAFKELSDTISGSHKDKQYFYIREVFERYLRSVNTYFIYELSRRQDRFNIVRDGADLPFDLEQVDWPKNVSFEDGVLKIGDKEVLTFNKGDRRDVIMKLFVARGKGLTIKELNDPPICKENDLRRTVKAIIDERLTGKKFVKIECDNYANGSKKYRLVLKP